uniref:Uncharacterized protein n=1 Tax=Aegilops tauschii subsp. strangulata TaxID=200361 RepID=A0A453HES6_AEGTS
MRICEMAVDFQPALDCNHRVPLRLHPLAIRFLLSNVFTMWNFPFKPRALSTSPQKKLCGSDKWIYLAFVPSIFFRDRRFN